MLSAADADYEAHMEQDDASDDFVPGETAQAPPSTSASAGTSWSD
jgi:hypothetical protein